MSKLQTLLPVSADGLRGREAEKVRAARVDMTLQDTSSQDMSSQKAALQAGVGKPTAVRRRRRARGSDVVSVLERRRRGDDVHTSAYRVGTFPNLLHCAGPDTQMLGLLSDLDNHIDAIARRCRTKVDAMRPAEAATFHKLVKKLDDALPPAGDDAGSLRKAFIELGGPCILQRAFAIPLDRSGEDGDSLPKAVEEALTLSLNVLSDVCTAEQKRTEGLSRSRGFMRNLFNFMRHPELLEWSLGLLLAAGDELFPLSTVDNLPGLVDSLTPKGLALFCRALAGIFSKSDDQAGFDGLPPPECVPPNLCTVCVNRAILLDIHALIPRIVKLLDVKVAPAWLCPTDEPVTDTWEDLNSGAARPDRAVLVTAEQLPPGLERTAVSMPIHGNEMFVVRLSEFSALAWATLKADLLFVIWELMGGKTRLQTQQVLVEHDFVGVLDRMFDALSWSTPTNDEGNPEAADPDGVCGPQSCLQIAILRALQAFCEKDGKDFHHHRLLLSARERRQLYGDARVKGSPTEADARDGDGLLHKLVKLMMSLENESTYRYWITSCVHKWMQASSWREQEFIAAIPGFLPFVVSELLATKICDNTHKAFCDLSAELVKFNPPLLERLSHAIAEGCDGHGAARFTEMVMGNIVNSSVLVHCISLTSSGLSCPPRSWLWASCNGTLGDVPSPAEPEPAKVGTTVVDSESSYSSMPVKALKAALLERGIDPSQFVEKCEMVSALSACQPDRTCTTPTHEEEEGWW